MKRASGGKKAIESPDDEFWDCYIPTPNVVQTHASLDSLKSILETPRQNKNGVTWREAIAVELLVDAITTIESFVRHKRGQQTVDAIRAAARTRGSSVLDLVGILQMFKAELEPKKRGPKAKSRAQGKVGRPQHWTRHWYRALLEAFEHGAEISRQKRKRVTNISAFREYFSEGNAQNPLKRHEIESEAKYAARRLSEARRVLLE